MRLVSGTTHLSVYRKARTFRVSHHVNKALLFSLFTFSFSLCSAQNHIIDSLKSELKTQHDDTNKVITLNLLSEKLWRTANYDTSLVIANNAEALAEKLTYKKGLAAAYRNIGVINEYLGNYPRALESHLKALDINRQIDNKSGIIRNLGSIGNVYDDEGNYPKALDYYFKALSLAQETGDKNRIAANLGNMGIVYHRLHNLDKSLESYLKALDIDHEIGEKYGEANNLGNIANIYEEKTDFSKAQEYYFKALAIHNELGNLSGTAATLGNIGNCFWDQKNVPKAIEYAQKSLALHRQLKDIAGIATNLGNIGDLYTEQKNYSQAKMCLDSALLLSKNIGEKEITRDVYNHMVLLDSATHNITQQVADYKMGIVYSDSLINEANTKKTVQAEMNYEFDQKQAAEKAEQDKKDAVAEQQRKKQAIIRNSLLAGFTLLIAMAFFIYRSYRQKHRAGIIIAKQKEEVEKSRKKVMDSIKYAQKIQYSILPSPDEIKKYMSDYFVCFMPKDIVSGDFYWFHHTDDHSYLAVVDCTGHGVPGACMSMLAHSFLNEVVIEKKISEPAEILSFMHQLVFRTLHQEKGDEYSQDGMDISLVVIDHKRGTAKFAGAKNNAFIIDGQNIITLKATAKSIGGLSLIGEIEPTRQFKSEAFEVKKGMLLVLSTDGIFDQLNAQDEKFGKARFNDLVMSASNTSTEQAQLLAEDIVNTWKANMQQQDDILVMGVKI